MAPPSVGSLSAVNYEPATDSGHTDNIQERHYLQNTSYPWIRVSCEVNNLARRLIVHNGTNLPRRGYAAKTTYRTSSKTHSRGPSPHDFSIEINDIFAAALGYDSVLFLPLEYCDNQDDSAAAQWQGSSNAKRCWKTCVIYEQIAEAHPRLTR
jgi:hypothetical protein